MFMCMTKKKKNTDPFSAALVEFLWRTKTTQQELATVIGYTNRNMIQAIIDERSPGSEPKRRAIANYFGYLYEDFLEVGRKIIAGDLGYIDYAMMVIHSRVDKAELAKQESSAQIRDSIKKVLIPSPATISPTPAPINLQDEADKKHQIVIEGFKDKDMALAINEALVELESLDTDALKDVYNYVIKMKLEPAREKKGLAMLQNQKTGTNQNK